MTIDILCKVIDNFGDIGVAWRLARALGELPAPPLVRLVVDDFDAFAALCPSIGLGAGRQEIGGVEVLPWRGEPSPEVLASYRDRPPASVVECFACGRPDWLEDLLFAPDAPASAIVDLEHLTAESYARELHLAPSLTRSARIRKTMFLPGFDEGTGGLVLDRNFALALERASSEAGRTGLRRDVLARIAAPPEARGPAGAAAPPEARGPAGAAAPPEARGPAGAAAAPCSSGPAGAVLAAPDDWSDRFWVTIFSYERDYSRIVADLAAFAARGDAAPSPGKENGPVGAAAAPASSPLLVLAAAGKSQACFLAAWEAAGRPFPAIALPFLPQEDWDRLLAASDFSIVRGEDSWARAALAGRPFLWQAYPQAERYHMVKVEAFLRRLQRHFRPADFGPIARAYRAINDRDRDEPTAAGDESLGPLLEADGAARAGFRAFGASLAPLTGLAADLLTFFRETV